MTITKMILLDKFKESALDLKSYLLVDDLQEFVGTDLYEYQVGVDGYAEIGKVTSIDIDQETGSLKVNDKVSFYDDFDFDFDVDGSTHTPKAITVLEIDASAPAPSGDEEEPVEEESVEEEESAEEEEPVDEELEP